MALRPCPECGTPLAHDAPSCIRCNKPDPFRRKSLVAVRSFLIRLVIAGMIFVGAGAYFWFKLLPELGQEFSQNTSQR